MTRLVELLGDLGAPPAVATAILLPLLLAILIAAVRAVALAVVRRRLRNPKSIKRWRRVTLYLALVVAGVAFQGIWMSSVAQIASWLSAVRGIEEDVARRWLEIGISILFSTAALALAIAVARTVHHAVIVRLRAWSFRARAIRFQRLEIISPARLRLMLATVVLILYYVWIVLVVAVYALFVLSIYPATAEFGASVLAYAGGIAMGILREIVAYLPNLVYLIIIWTAASYAIKGVRFVLEAVGRRTITLPNFLKSSPSRTSSCPICRPGRTPPAPETMPATRRS